MRLAGRPKLNDFAAHHRDARADLELWAAEIEAARWRTPHDLRADYPSASLVGGGRVVFNIRHNRYRLDALIDFRNQQVVVVRVGTHAEYDRWTF